MKHYEGNTVGATRQARLAGLALLVCVCAVYGPVSHYEFVNLDDNVYVQNNPMVARGLTLEGLHWAMRADLTVQTPHADYWMPVTILSRMLDVSLFGMNPGAHHVVNVLFHALNVLLLFALWRRASNRLWPSFCIAALFALHPVHVESVAWITERKDVLGMLFLLLTVNCYLSWCDCATPLKYLGMLVFFVLGLMSKPLVITLPVLFLLLDVWPARRLPLQVPETVEDWVRTARLLLEKLPFAVLSAASIAVTLRAHTMAGAVSSLTSIGPGTRLANAAASMGSYLGRLVWPQNLAIVYPWTQPITAVQVGAGIFVVLIISVVVFDLRHCAPWLFTGWGWFLCALAPFLGVIQTGPQRMADRFLYVPALGLYAAVVWGFSSLASDIPGTRRWIRWGTTAILLALGLRAALQVRCWQDSETLLKRTLAVTENNYLAHNNLASHLIGTQRFDDAAEHARQATRIRPDYGRAWTNLGAALLLGGNAPEAVSVLREALERNPNSVQSRSNLAAALSRTGDLEGAARAYGEALELTPDNAETRNDLAGVLARLGRTEDARRHLSYAVKVSPDLVEARVNLARNLSYSESPAEALRHYEKVLTQQPRWRVVRLELAWLQATHPDPALRDPLRAVDACEQMILRDPQPEPAVLQVLAAGYAAQGRYTIAVGIAERALDLARRGRLRALEATLTEHLRLYRQERPIIIAAPPRN